MLTSRIPRPHGHVHPSRRSRLATALPSAAALALLPGLFAPAAPSPDSAARPSSTLAFADEFDGPAGAPPDPARWTHEVNGDGGGNNELQYYTDSTDNAALDGEGHLVITARRENPANYQCCMAPASTPPPG